MALELDKLNLNMDAFGNNNQDQNIVNQGQTTPVEPQVVTSKQNQGLNLDMDAFGKTTEITQADRLKAAQNEVKFGEGDTLSLNEKLGNKPDERLFGIGKGFMAGNVGVQGGSADIIDVLAKEHPLTNTIAQTLTDAGKELAKSKRGEELSVLSPEYWTDPEGIFYDVGELLGNSFAFSKLIGGAGWLLSKGAKAAAPLFSKVAEKSPLVANVVERVAPVKNIFENWKANHGKLNEVGKVMAYQLYGVPFDALINSGGAAKQYLAQHPGDYEGANGASATAFITELPMDIFNVVIGLHALHQNPLTSKTALKRITKDISSNIYGYMGAMLDVGKMAGWAALDSAVEGAQEGTQDRAVKRGTGEIKSFIDVYNPFKWSDEDLRTFSRVAAASAVTSLIGGGAQSGYNLYRDISSDTSRAKATREVLGDNQQQVNIANNPIANIATNEKENNNGISLQELQNVETEKSQPAELPPDKQVVEGSNNGQETQVKDILATTPADRVKYYTENEEGAPEQLNIQDQAFIDSILAIRKNVKQVEDIDGKPAYEFTSRGNKYFATIDMTQPTKQPQEQPVVEPTGQANADRIAGAEPANVDNTQQRVDYWQDAHSSPIDNPTFGRMTTENGNTVAVRYGFTSPDVLNVSHDPFTYEPNANYDQRLQQRNRQGIQMKQQVENNAARLNPALLGYSDGVNMGAPVVITDSNNVDTVINGNGRAMAIIRAMQTNPENIKAYHKYLIKHAYDYGWTPEQVTQYITEHPKAILVRQVNEDDNMIQEIAGATGGGMSLSAAEQAARDASKVPEYVWQKYQPNEKGEIDNTSNHEFVDGVLKNITNQNEINEFMPDINGDLSVPGAMRVRNALFAYAYGDKRLISDVANFAGGDSMTSQVVNGLTRAAGDVAKARAAMKANGKEELNFIPKLVEAARTVRQFGRDEQALEKEINSISMFSEEDAGRNIMALDDETKRVLAVLFANKGSGANIGKFIKGMANAVIRTAEAETDVFGADDLPKTIMDVIEEGAEVGGIKQTDLGKKEGAENGYNARTRGNAEEGNSQEQSGEIGERSKGESGEGVKGTSTSTADIGRTPATTGKVKNQEQLAEAVTTGKLSQESELENLQDSLERVELKEYPKEVIGLADTFTIPNLSNKDINDARQVAKDILGKIKEYAKDTFDWKSKEPTRAHVWTIIADNLYSNLPSAYDDIINQEVENFTERAFNYVVGLKSTDGETADNNAIKNAFEEGGIINGDRISNLSMSEMRVIDDIFNGKHPNITPATKGEKESEENGNGVKRRGLQTIPQGEQLGGVQASETDGATGQSGSRENRQGGRSVQQSGGSNDERQSGVGENVDRVSGTGDDQRSDVSPQTVRQRDGQDRRDGGQRGVNYTITDEDGIGSGSVKVKAQNNIAAIKLLKQLEKEGRMATPEEQKILAKYVGWGGIPQVFDSDIKKEWKAEQNELKSLLTDKEYAQARGTTLSAFYTPPSVINTIWKGLEKGGFKGGRILDPSMGVGNYFGTMPQQMRNESDLYGVEIDAVSGGIAKQLYQGARVDITGFEKTKYPDDYFDLVISNVPFITDKTYDEKYKSKYGLQNLFFAKAVDKVRPGGLICFIASPDVLNSNNGDSVTLREQLQDKVDFVGAVALPNTTFKSNANTSASSHLIILKKLNTIGEHSNYDNHPWRYTEPITLKNKNGEEVSKQINEYFVANSQNSIGEYVIGGQYGNSMELGGKGRDVAKELSSVLNRIIPRADLLYSPVKRTQTQSNNIDNKGNVLAPSNARPNTFIKQDGKVYYNDNGVLVALDRKTETLAGDYADLKAALTRVLDAQIDESFTDDMLKQRRDELNKVYDSFVAKHGYINEGKNSKVLNKDEEYGLVSSIEDYKVDKKRNIVITTKKRDIFEKRTASATAQTNSADNIDDALLLSFNQKGRLDVEYMAQLLNKDKEVVVEELGDRVFYDPKERDYVSRGDYLSGNVREKLRVAEDAVKSNAFLERNVEALRKVQPKDLVAGDIKVQLGTPWIPPSDIMDFAKHIFEGENSGRTAPVEVRFNPKANNWAVEGNWYTKNGTIAEAKYGTKRRPFLSILKAALNNRTIVVEDEDKETGKKYTNAKETELANAKVEELQQVFKDWIWKDADRKKRLVDYFNENYNNWVLKEYDGSFITPKAFGYNITAPDLRKHQLDAIARIIQDQNVLIAHGVGAGKTWTMQWAAMELKRLGIAQKSMHVLPNNIIRQYEKEWYRIAPNAKLLVLTSQNLPAMYNLDRAPRKNEKSLTKAEFTEKKRQEYQEVTAKRQAILSRIATEDWDGIIISHDLFQRIPVGEEILESFYQKQIDDIVEAIEESAGDRLTVKDLEQQRVSIQSKLDKQLNALQKDKGLTFDKLGINRIFVDEADMFKNLEFVTRIRNVKGIQHSGSNRSMDMYLKTQWLNNNGGGTIFATGTPISNTFAEMFTMQRYLGSDDLNEHNIWFFDSWASMFAEKGDDSERSPDGNGYRQVTKFTNFNNLTELKIMFRKFADVITSEQLSEILDIPELKMQPNGERGVTVVEVESNPALDNFIKVVAKGRAQAIHNGGVDPKDDNMLKLTGELRKASLDMRLIDPNIPASEAAGKVEAAAQNIARIYKEKDSVKGAQLVFCDLSVPKAKKEKADEGVDETSTEFEAEEADSITVYEEIKKRCIELGVPADEIAFVHDAKNADQKQELFESVNNGDVRVLIGSTSKMGAGTNCQEHLVALHHIDAPWRPRDIEQREGRILRQGNLNKEVEILVYITKDSFDANMWEKLKNKAKMINQLMSGDLSVRSMDDVGENVVTYAEIEALSSGNPLMKERTEIESKFMKLSVQRNSYLRNKAEMEDKVERLPKTIENYEKMLENAKHDAGLKTFDEDNFKIEVNGKTYTKKADARSDYTLMLEKFNSKTPVVLMRIGDFVVQGKYIQMGEIVTPAGGGTPYTAARPEVMVKITGGKNTYLPNSSGFDAVLNAIKREPDRVADVYSKAVDKAKAELRATEEELNAPFKYEDEFQRVVARKAELDEIFANWGKEETHATILANDEYTSGRVFNDVVNEAKEAFKGADIVPNKDNKTFTIKFKNGQNVTLDIVDEIIATPEDMERYKAAHGKLPKAIKAVTKTKLTKAGLQAIVQVSTKHSQYGDLFHESFHIAAKLFLSGKQYNSLMDYFDKTRGSSQATPEELAADGYKAWRKAREERRGTLWGKLYQKVLDGCNAVLGLFNTKKRLVNNIFKQMESGELFNGKVNNAKDSVSFTGIDDNKNEALASVVSSPARTGWKGAYDKGGITGVINHVYDELYTDWVDKFHPIDNFDKDTNAKKGERLLDRVHMVGALTSGFTNTLIDGNEKSIKVVEEQINAKLHNVTFKDVLSVIDPKEMDKLYPNYLAQFGKGKDWHDMFGTYLVWRRLAEMSKLHDQAYIQEYKEWLKKVEAEKYWAENDGSESTRPEPPGAEPKYKPYKLPNNLTEEDLLNGIEQAPEEFERAANLFYLWNDNILTILERGNIISPDTHRLLNTKYKNYCSLMRDFSEEGAFSDYLSGLNNGGKGIANVKTTLKRISEAGSERLVLNPLEVAVKACAIAVNRAERNKVAMFAVDKLEQSGYGLIVPVKGEAHPDPGRCIFTVMFEGKPKAYKCVPELYEPITLMDKNSSGIVMEAMSAAARALRTGATISPSFSLRNFSRDTMQAGIASSNGFIPIVSSIQGAWEILNDEQIAAEIRALGVTSFNFYTHRDAIQKTIRDLAPKRNAVTWQDAKDVFMRAFGMEDFSAFVEASTRAGEYYLARKHGKSMLEAALDARRVTIDFARSGRLGQQVNRVIPFFNATIQGTDINARLVGGGIKAAYNIATGNKQEGDLQKLRIFAKILCYAIVPALILRALNSDEPWYDELDPRIKYSNWVLPNKVVVPMSQEWGLYASLALATMDNIQKNDKKAYENWRQLVRETIAPNVLPTMILPIIEGLANYSFWTGKPLANQRLMKLPPEQRAYASTSELSKWFGKQTGIAPVIIDNTIRGYTGTMGTFTWGVAGDAIYAMAGEEKNKPAKAWNERTFIRDFAVNDNKLRRYTDEFMNISKEAEQRKDEYKPYMKGINSLNRKITDLYKMNRGIDEGKIYPKHSPEFKKQLKDRNFEKIRKLSKIGVERYGDKIKH